MSAPCDQISFVIVGGNSRSATALRRRIGGRSSLAVVRGTAGPGELAIEDYARPPADLDLRGAVVVNCAGAVAGTRDDLLRANVETAARWARLAAGRGARQFIQISSFSIFGGAEEIGAHTPVAPHSHYGESKLLAEQALAELASEALPMSMLRVPILVGSGKDKLAKLVGFGRRTGFTVAAPWPSPRSMLPYDGLAAAIERLAGQPQALPWQTPFAADPDPFDAQMMVDEANAVGRSIKIVRAPTVALKLLKAAAPGMYASLFRPSLLDLAANILADAQGFTPLRSTIASMLRDGMRQ